MGERNKGRERESVQDKKGRALRSVYTDSCTRNQEIGVNAKQLSWRDLQHIHAAGERNENSKGSHCEFLVELIGEERVGQFPEVQLAE